MVAVFQDRELPVWNLVNYRLLQLYFYIIYGIHQNGKRAKAAQTLNVTEVPIYNICLFAKQVIDKKHEKYIRNKKYVIGDPVLASIEIV